MKTLTFLFKGKFTKEAFDIFRGWYLDGGGDDGFHISCTENEGIEFTQTWDENTITIDTDSEEY
jgi:hypothetical protein